MDSSDLLEGAWSLDKGVIKPKQTSQDLSRAKGALQGGTAIVAVSIPLRCHLPCVLTLLFSNVTTKGHTNSHALVQIENLFHLSLASAGSG